MLKKTMSDKPPCTTRHVEMTYKDLPLSCPPRDERIWDAHPRVYLTIEETGAATCPYCGTQFTLKDFSEEKAIEKIQDDGY
jgi:uncharacterized Zn-finger protein